MATGRGHAGKPAIVTGSRYTGQLPRHPWVLEYWPTPYRKHECHRALTLTPFSNCARVTSQATRPEERPRQRGVPSTAGPSVAGFRDQALYVMHMSKKDEYIAFAAWFGDRVGSYPGICFLPLGLGSRLFMKHRGPWRLFIAVLASVYSSPPSSSAPGSSYASSYLQVWQQQRRRRWDRVRGIDIVGDGNACVVVHA
eukprot:366181-Chlamydomonas_euryale.AAC.11